MRRAEGREESLEAAAVKSKRTVAGSSEQKQLVGLKRETD
jgi:hypothetical protein